MTSLQSSKLFLYNIFILNEVLSLNVEVPEYVVVDEYLTNSLLFFDDRMGSFINGVY